ncbi:hypothetical protein BX666DRAFT_2024889 [Dichotomocladium elegans]|nr:hypothetical protein BX666DRAFT_2024889 [Dichotomocladium elegans]
MNHRLFAFLVASFSLVVVLSLAEKRDPVSKKYGDVLAAEKRQFPLPFSGPSSRETGMTSSTSESIRITAGVTTTSTTTSLSSSETGSATSTSPISLSISTTVPDLTRTFTVTATPPPPASSTARLLTFNIYNSLLFLGATAAIFFA